MLKTFIIPKPRKVVKTYLLGCDDIAIWDVFTNRPNIIIGYTEVYVVPKEETIPSDHYDLYTMDNYLSYKVTETPIYLSNFHYYESASGVEFNLNLGAVNFSTHKVWVLFTGAPEHYDGTTFIPRLDHQIYEFTSSTDFDNMEYVGDAEISTMGYIPLHLGGSYWYTTLIFSPDDDISLSMHGEKTCSISITGNIGDKDLLDYNYSDDPDYWPVICLYRENKDNEGNIIDIVVELRIPYEDTKPEIYGGSNPTAEGLGYEFNFYTDLDHVTPETAYDYYDINIDSEFITINDGKAPVMEHDSRGPLYE